MTRRKKIVVGVVIIVVLVGGLLTLRISSWNQNFGLSEDVIAGKVEPSAEETVQLYFYYRNRSDHNAAKQLETDRLQTTDKQVFDSHAFGDDLKLINVEYISTTYSRVKKWENAYKVTMYEANFNEGSVYVSSKVSESSKYFRFTLIQAKKGGLWKIDSIGK